MEGHGRSERNSDFLGRLKDATSKLRYSAFVIGFASLLWYAFRTGAKPSRAVYPCQQAAKTNGALWLTA